MSLKERISNDLKTAMKASDKVRTETLRTLRAALLEKEIEKRGPDFKGLTNEEELGVITTAAKKRKESIEQFDRAGRTALADQERSELVVIQEYLPKQLTIDEVEKVIAKVVSEAEETSRREFGRIMPAVMKELKGKADGKLIQELVRKHVGI